MLSLIPRSREIKAVDFQNRNLRSDLRLVRARASVATYAWSLSGYLRLEPQWLLTLGASVATYAWSLSGYLRLGTGVCAGETAFLILSLGLGGSGAGGGGGS